MRDSHHEIRKIGRIIFAYPETATPTKNVFAYIQVNEP